MYRILTEDLNRPGIISILDGLGLDFTAIPAVGSWKTPERSLVIDIETYRDEAVLDAAKQIAELNCQEAVMVQYIQSTCSFVNKEGKCTILI